MSQTDKNVALCIKKLAAKLERLDPTSQEAGAILQSLVLLSASSRN